MTAGLHLAKLGALAFAWAATACVAPGQPASGRLTTVPTSTGAVRIEAEDMKRTGGNSLSRSGWAGAILYENKDALRMSFAFGAAGRWRIDIRGSSSDKHPAGVAVFIDGQARAAGWFAARTPEVLSLIVDVETAGKHELRLSQTTDVGENDVYLDWIEVAWSGPLTPAPIPPTTGAVGSGAWRNLFVERGYPPAQVARKIEEAWQSLFHGDPDNEAVYYEKGQNANGPLAYVMDVGNGDVRSEGMSYGMMVAVELDHQHEFDALWNWVLTYMAHPNPADPNHGYFSWQMRPDGKVLDPMPATDGEEYLATALYFAQARWGGGKGIYDYRAQADRLLRAMRLREQKGGVTTLFNPEQHQPISPATATTPTRPTTCRRSTKSGRGWGRRRNRPSGSKPSRPAATSSSVRRILRPGWCPTTPSTTGGPSPGRAIPAASIFATTPGEPR
jgi:hypothetical protein